MIWDSLGNRILWLRARDFVRRYEPTLIGITGSTSTALVRRATAAVLTAHHKIRESPAYSTLPLQIVHTILGIDTAAQRYWWLPLLTRSRLREFAEKEPTAIVVDLPVKRPGDIDILATRLPFSYGMITNIHSVPLSLFSRKDILAHEAASLIVNVPKTGYAILNSDDPVVYEMRKRTAAKVVLFGTSKNAAVRLTRSERLSSFGLACEVIVNGKIYELHLPHIIGRHQASAFLAALAVATTMNTNITDALTRLRKLDPPPGQLCLLRGVNNTLLMDDSYDATPESMMDALATLQEVGTTPASHRAGLGGQRAIHRRIAIIGDIADIGAESQKWYEKIGAQAGKAAHVVIAVGEEISAAGAEALRAGADVHHFKSSRDVSKWLAPYLKQGDLVLVCGSRGIRMEETVRELLADPEKDAHLLVNA
jgi:UDP-N-acetylmuramoyl-tripeptide--D-alanyl-D-alanine ligase